MTHLEPVVLDPAGHRCNAWWPLEGQAFDPMAVFLFSGRCGQPAVSVVTADDGQPPLAVCRRHQDALVALRRRLDSQNQ